MNPKNVQCHFACYVLHLQEAVYQFQKNHKSLDGLRERKTSLIRMIENETDKLEREITDHCTEQVESLKECEKNLSVAMEKVMGLFCEFTKLNNSDVLKYKDVKRQLCQQVFYQDLQYQDKLRYFNLFHSLSKIR